MGASNTEGRGHGIANRLSPRELTSLANGPVLYFTGISAGSDIPASSPPSIGNTVTFPYPLTGGADNYVVLLTTANAGAVYVSDLLESGGNFTGFEFVSEADGDVMYLVAGVGTKSQV